ncbi:MAG: hypothetical protein KGZ58_01105 [Ignavibacteriales bacterium]|nr:hypothetical protein [Ignavibacteriales bacterium]
MSITLKIENISQAGVEISFTHFSAGERDGLTSLSGHFTVHPANEHTIGDIREMAVTRLREILKTESEAKMRFD